MKVGGPLVLAFEEKRERNEELFLWSWKRAEGGGEVREGLLVLGTETK